MAVIDYNDLWAESAFDFVRRLTAGIGKGDPFNKRYA
jgi:hypothetical protein